MSTLIEAVRDQYIHQARKHGLKTSQGEYDPEAFADEHINRMTNVELLQEISDHLEENYE